MKKGTKFKHLSWNDRLTIARMIDKGYKKAAIADAIGCHVNTIYNELKRASYEHLNSDYTVTIKYNPDQAQTLYEKHLQEKGSISRLEADSSVKSYISDLILKLKFSPEACLFEIKNHPEIDFEFEIKSVNTIYNGIRKGYFPELTMTHLPRRGKTYQKRQRVIPAQKAAIGTSIEKRPEEVLKREAFGNWEMDCVVGKSVNRKTLLVLTERKTRYEIIEVLKNHSAGEVVRAMNRLEKRFKSDFYKVFKTITVDNGAEFSDTIGIQKALYRIGNRSKIYYCHPRSPQERGSNEVNNHLIRRWFPKGTDFDKAVTRTIAKNVEFWINTYPRRLFKGRASVDLFNEELAAQGCRTLVS